MKKFSQLIIFSLFLPLFFTSCSHKPKVSGLEKGAAQNLADLPEWVSNPSVKDGVAGVGIAPASRGGISFQIPRAETDAKANIAAEIQSEISRVTKNALRSSKVNDVDDVEEVFTQATKEVVKNMPLSGAKRVNIYQAKDRTLYIRMVLKDADYSRYIQNSQKVYEARLKQADLSRKNLNRSQAAVKELFDELEEERNRDD